MNRQVLMLEGDGDDRYITTETVSKLGIDIPIRFFSGSIEFYRYLETAERPALIMIDYNSQPHNGLEVLKRLKSDERYADIPVVILSDSDHPRYKDECYRHGASSFIRKPDTPEATTKKIAAFFDYWFEVVGV